MPLTLKRNRGPIAFCDITKDLLYLETESEDQIAAVHIRRGLRGTDRVILYSHGNAEDLGQRLHLGGSWKWRALETTPFFLVKGTCWLEKFVGWFRIFLKIFLLGKLGLEHGEFC